MLNLIKQAPPHKFNSFVPISPESIICLELQKKKIILYFKKKLVENLLPITTHFFRPHVI